VTAPIIVSSKAIVKRAYRARFGYARIRSIIMSVLLNKAKRGQVNAAGEVSHSLVKSAHRIVVLVLTIAGVLLLAVPLADDPTRIAIVRGKRAQELVDQLRASLSIESDVAVVVVPYHPLVFSVEPTDRTKKRFLLSMELGFLQMLNDDELRASLAHELGHVWIYTHHPYLQTERLANEIGMRSVTRESLEKVYTKLWNYEGTTGVPIEQLLGPAPSEPWQRPAGSGY
jgi:hypothetical protein